MDHRDFLHALPAATKASLTAKSNRAGLWHLAGHLAAVAICGALIAAGVPVWPLLLPVQGVLIVSAFRVQRVRRGRRSAA